MDIRISNNLNWIMTARERGKDNIAIIIRITNLT